MKTLCTFQGCVVFFKEIYPWMNLDVCVAYQAMTDGEKSVLGKYFVFILTPKL